ncbi:MAG: hypothetical protein A2Y23_10875 [Clostridiales bacterium GWB2_37_7]|nr:MAG: hypothetical protein A2Y23_10875 [Clostridiales bacterium GWB2_37_7]
MDNYNVLVLMQRDSESKILTETIDSYTLREGMELIESAYLMEEEEPFIYLILTTQDVEDWQYYGVYDLYTEELFEGLVEEILDGSGEFNPRWIFKFKYVDNRMEMEEKLNQLIKLHTDEIHRILPIIEGNKAKYQREAENEE